MMPAKNPEIVINIQRVVDHPALPTDADLESWISAAISRPKTHHGQEITVRFVTPEESQHLNSTFRGIDRPTNVLSFPADEFANADGYIGDLAVCVTKVIDEATQQDKSLAHHCAHLVVHGTLHCLGYTHDTDPNAQAMEDLEVAILAQFNIANPYGEP